ncbi:hypothetical protein Tco_1240605, partial [Tanacetum coccineum]
IWEAFGGKTRDLGSILEETGRRNKSWFYSAWRQRHSATSSGAKGDDVMTTCDAIATSREMLGLKYILVLLKLMLPVMIVTAAGYVSTAGEVQRKYSKSLLLPVVKLLLLVLVTTARRVYAVRGS